MPKKKQQSTIRHKMILPQIKCVCSEIIVKSQGDSSKIRSKIIIIKNNQVFAVCKSCGREIAIPLMPVSKKSALYAKI